MRLEASMGVLALLIVSENCAAHSPSVVAKRQDPSGFP